MSDHLLIVTGLFIENFNFGLILITLSKLSVSVVNVLKPSKVPSLAFLTEFSLFQIPVLLSKEQLFKSN